MVEENPESHYHICTGPRDNMPISDVKFEKYEESLHCFTSLANAMFRNLRDSDYDLSLEQALEATDHGNSRGAFVGPPTLTLYWLRCEAEVHDTPAWN